MDIHESIACVRKLAYKIVDDANDLAEIKNKFVIAKQMTTEGKRFLNLRRPATEEYLADCLIEWAQQTDLSSRSTNDMMGRGECNHTS